MSYFNGLVVVDGTYLMRAGRDRGLGRYTRELLSTLAEAGVAYRELAPKVRVGPRIGEFIEFYLRSIRLRRSPRSFQVYHAVTPYTLAQGFLRQTVVSIHDLIPLDLPEYSKTGLKARFFHHRIREAGAALASSIFTRGRALELLGLDSARVIVAPLPVPRAYRDFAHAECRLPEQLYNRPYIAAMADFRTPDPRKRIAWLTWAAGALSRAGLSLAVVGPGSRERNPREGWLGLGQLPDRAVAEVFHHAGAFLYTSSYEGQGLPPLEAMSLGTPVVCMKNSSLVEVVGGGGVLIDESGEPRESVEELVRSCVEMLAKPELRRTLSVGATAHARTFTVERFRKCVLQAYTIAQTDAES